MTVNDGLATDDRLGRWPLRRQGPLGLDRPPEKAARLVGRVGGRGGDARFHGIAERLLVLLAPHVVERELGRTPPDRLEQLGGPPVQGTPAAPTEPLVEDAL